MNYVVQINAGPQASNAGLIAYRFIQAALEHNHSVLQVFFYQEGIRHALRYALPPDDEYNMPVLWSQLAREHGIDLVVCISAAQRRGLLCLDEARRQGLEAEFAADGFRIAGLGQWLDATLSADRCLVFG
jgi:tRNA 2-thiouridine synthesizing protein D